MRATILSLPDFIKAEGTRDCPIGAAFLASSIDFGSAASCALFSGAIMCELRRRQIRVAQVGSMIGRYFVVWFGRVEGIEQRTLALNALRQLFYEMEIKPCVTAFWDSNEMIWRPGQPDCQIVFEALLTDECFEWARARLAYENEIVEKLGLELREALGEGGGER